MTALALLLICPDVDRLGSPDWPAREAAQDRLAAWGLLAVPAIAEAGNAHASPEVRDRCRRLLVPWRALAADLEAAAVLLAPGPPDMDRFYRDGCLRLRVHRLAVALGCDECCTRALHPRFDPWHQPWGVSVWWSTALSLERCRAKVRAANP